MSCFCLTWYSQPSLRSTRFLPPCCVCSYVSVLVNSCLVLFACLTVHCYLQSLLHLQRSSCRARLQLNVLLEKGQESRRMQQCIKAKTSTTMVCVRFWSAHPGEGCTILPELLYFHHKPDFLLKLSALCLRSISCLAFTSTHDTHTFRFSLSLAYIGVRRPDIQ